MAPVRLTVEEIHAGTYPVLMGPHALRALDRWLANEAREAQCFVLGDEHTLEQCLPELLAHVPMLREVETIQVRSGEGTKDLEVCRALWVHLSEKAADRNTVLINLGGGVISDLGGFVGATYKRGVRVIHVPTTVMGMVDASIGGKTAIDLAGIKNLVGTFSDPVAVYIHTPFLRSLGKRELLNGVAEMIKHGLVRDTDHWNALRRAPLHDIDALAPLIARSAAIKAAIVTEDPLEKGPRKLLNFGHTIGHALEALALEGQQRSLLHGEAVAIGMVCETWLSWRFGMLDRDRMNAIQQHLLELFPAHEVQLSDHHRLIELMRNDKKNAGDQFRFTLLTGIGSAQVDVPVTAAQAAEALDHYRLLIRDAQQHHHPQA